MSFNDIFKSSFLESVTEFSIVDTLLGLAAALVIGLFIFVIYKKTLTGVMYSSGFALTLIGLSLVTTLVIMAVTSNVVFPWVWWAPCLSSVSVRLLKSRWRSCSCSGPLLPAS